MTFTNLAVNTFRCLFQFVFGAPVAFADTTTITAASLLSGLIIGTPTAAANYTTPTAAQILDAMGGSGNAKVGDCFDFYLRNVSAGAYTITLVAGTGITLATGNTNTATQANTRMFRGVVTAVGASPAITIYSVLSAAH